MKDVMRSRWKGPGPPGGRRGGPGLSLAALGLLALGVLAAAAGPADAKFIVSGTTTDSDSGISHTVSGQATFSIDATTGVLTVVVQNTTKGGTLAQGDALTGIEWDISGASPTSKLTSISLTTSPTQSNIVTNKLGKTDNSLTLFNSATGGQAWTNVLSSGATYGYGVGSTGFNGQFNGSTITIGNSSPNYSLVAAGTTFSALGGSQYPFIEDSLTFTFSGFSGVKESQINSVSLLFGTSGNSRTTSGTAPPPTSSVPAPGSLVLALSGLVPLGLVCWRRKRQLSGIAPR